MSDNEIREAITNRLKKIVPNLVMKNDWGGRIGDNIRLSVSSPLPYMGHFVPRKINWTIDMLETAAYTRTRQIRVKVTDKDVSFKEEKLMETIGELKAIIERHKQEKTSKQKTMTKLPTIPKGMSVVAKSDGLYEVKTYHLLDLEAVRKLAENIFPHLI